MTAGKEDISVVVLSAPEECEVLLTLFEEISEQEGWQPGEQLRWYQDRSVYFGVFVSQELAGGLQVVLPQVGQLLPCGRVWPEVKIDSGISAHLPVMAIRPEYRGHLRLFWPLCVALWRFCVAEGIETLLLETTPSMLVRYRDLGWPLEIIGDLREHWGEDCYLCQVQVQAVAGAMLTRAVRSPAFRTLVQQAMKPLRSDCTLNTALP